MNIDKSELSTKKMRKKLMKQVRNKLYSNFVKSGTLMGGKMEEESHESQVVEIKKDLSKIKELSDDQLVTACGGMTAHKGARHGLNMKAKLDRIAEAEREFMLKYGGGLAADSSETSDAPKKKKKRKHENTEDNYIDTKDSENVQPKKKKKKKDKSAEKVSEVGDTEVEHEPIKKKKKSKKSKSREV